MDLVTSCTNPYSASEGAHHDRPLLCWRLCLLLLCTISQKYKKLSRFPCSRPVHWVGRVQNAWLGKGASRLSSFECCSRKAQYISFKLWYTFLKLLRAHVCLSKFMENTFRFMRQWWNQPLCLMVRHFINRCLLFLDLAKKRVNAKRVRISLKRRSKDPSPWGVGQDWFLCGNNWEADCAPGDRGHIEVTQYCLSMLRW